MTTAAVRMGQNLGAAQARPTLTIRDLRVSYGKVHALTGVDLAVRQGTIMAVVGMNGSGKSTLFNSIMGLVPTRSGEIRVCGRSSHEACRAGLIGYVPQTDGIDKDFPITVGEVVMMGRYGKMNWRRKPHPSDVEAVADALEIVGLTNLAARPIGALSGGQRKRAFVARAVAQGARVILLDEPFAGVDYTSETLITDLLNQLAGAGATLLISTHDLASIHKFADEVALLNQKIYTVDTPERALVEENLLHVFCETR